jgi:hypothetical protein
MAPKSNGQPARVGEPFPRPTTVLNRVVARIFSREPVRRLDDETLAHCQEITAHAFLKMGGVPSVIADVRSPDRWMITEAAAPSDAWGGEVLVSSSEGVPWVLMYQDCTLTRIRSQPIFILGLQLAVDHMFSHLYEYYRGSEDYGEHAATRWQFWLLRKRGGLKNNALAWLLAVTSVFHKGIPLWIYWPRPAPARLHGSTGRQSQVDQPAGSAWLIDVGEDERI